MKKVAFIHEYFPYGGAERVTINIINELLSHNGENYEFFVFTAHYNRNMLPSVVDENKFHVIENSSANLEDPNSWNFILDNVESNHIDIVMFVCLHINGLEDKLHNLGCKTIFANHGVPFWEINDKKAVYIKPHEKV